MMASRTMKIPTRCRTWRSIGRWRRKFFVELSSGARRIRLRSVLLERSRNQVSHVLINRKDDRMMGDKMMGGKIIILSVHHFVILSCFCFRLTPFYGGPGNAANGG